MSCFTRVPDDCHIVFVEGNKLLQVTDTYSGALERFTRHPDINYRFYLELNDKLLEVHPVIEYYSGLCIEFVIDKRSESLMKCYRCDKGVSWLAPDSRCKDCTGYTPEEVRGEAEEEADG